MSEKDGGPAHLCGRGQCRDVAVRRQGHQWLCPKHYRFSQIIAGAKRKGKSVPTHAQLESIVLPENRCADCNVVMNWLAVDNQTLVATFQHYRDGCYGLVCRSCNTRHAYMPDDSFCSMPKDNKYCPKCTSKKPFSEFSRDNGRSGPMKLKSWCKQCSSEAHREWRQHATA